MVTTLHTVLSEPTPIQRRVFIRDSRRSPPGRRHGGEGEGPAVSVYDVPHEKIEVIPHGIPDVPYRPRPTRQSSTRLRRPARHPHLRSSLPEQGHRSHDRCDAGDPASRPDGRVCGARRDPSESGAQQGEAYRESLVARARELGVEDHVVFLDRFVDQATLLDFISMCDVYVRRI